MTSVRALRMGAMGVALLYLALPAAGDDADDIIAEIVRAAKTRTEAAKQLVAAAGTLRDAPAVQVRVCEKAYELGITGPSGYASALAALDVLDTMAPLKAATLRAKRLEVYRLLYIRGPRADRPANGRAYVKLLTAAGDAQEKLGTWRDTAKYHWQAYTVARALNLPERKALYQRARDAEARAMTRARLATLKAAVEKDPKDVSARRQLVTVYLVDLDEPRQAARHLSATLDATLKNNVSLAAGQVSELADEDFLTLGQWYRALAARTGIKQAKGRLLTRSSTYLNMYLEVHTRQDMDRMKAFESLKGVDAELKELGLVASGAAMPTKGLVLHYTFSGTKGGRGQVTDASGKGHHGRATGADRVPDARGKGNPAAAFDGRNDWVDAGAPKALKMPDAVTVCAWILPASFGGYRNVLSDHGRGGNNGKIFRLQNRRIEFMIGPEGTADVGWQIPAAGKWHHVVVTYDGATMHLYADGALKASRPLKGKVPVNPNPVLIGKSGFREYFHGMLDDVMLYDRALTGAEVAQLHTAQRGR